MSAANENPIASILDGILKSRAEAQAPADLPKTLHEGYARIKATIDRVYDLDQSVKADLDAQVNDFYAHVTDTIGVLQEDHKNMVRDILTLDTYVLAYAERIQALKSELEAAETELSDMEADMERNREAHKADLEREREARNADQRARDYFEYR